VTPQVLAYSQQGCGPNWDRWMGELELLRAIADLLQWTVSMVQFVPYIANEYQHQGQPQSRQIPLPQSHAKADYAD
jgi:hypothetical protein